MPSSLRSRRPDPPQPRPPLLAQARARLTIHASRAVTATLDGEYRSMHHDRSTDFDDLREYVLGDDVKDIDWKATSRSGRPLVKRYLATRRHHVVLVVFTGRSMAALAAPGTAKRDVAVHAAGVISHLALRHGDAVGLVAGPVPAPAGVPPGIVHLAASRSAQHAERLLRTVADSIRVDGPDGRLEELLPAIAARVRTRSILVVLTDDVPLSSAEDLLLRQLAARHDVVVVAVGDVAVTTAELRGRVLRDVARSVEVPRYLRTNVALADELAAAAAQQDRDRRATLARAGIAATRIDDVARVPADIADLLARHRTLRRRP